MVKELTRSAWSGYFMLFVVIFLLLFSLAVVITGGASGIRIFVMQGVFGLVISAFLGAGFFIVNPNQARVLVLFGKYKGTVKQNGFFWANPFFVKTKVSLRARNLNGERLKVNDKSGNPIEIAAVVVWQVADTARASFDVDDYKHYVIVQSEAAVRHLAGSYPYDTWEDDHEGVITLREGTEIVSQMLEKELRERFSRAGVEVIEARISHLAYAPEIAEAMLRRQQASAVVAARTQIVDGAVGMVSMALEKLSHEGIIEFDEDKKATMVSNLLVVLCGESSVHPVINAGTLHQ